jgi:hypothetical protein
MQEESELASRAPCLSAATADVGGQHVFGGDGLAHVTINSGDGNVRKNHLGLQFGESLWSHISLNVRNFDSMY